MNNQEKLVAIFRNTFLELGDKTENFISGCTRGEIASWDSGNHFVLITCIEEDFGITLTDEYIANMYSFFDVYKAIEELSEQ